MKRCFGGRAFLVAAALVALLPIGIAGAQESNQLNQVNSRVEFSSVSRTYSSMDPRYARNGTRRSLAQVRSITVGQSQDSLQAALGRPALRNGDGSLEFHLSLPLTGRDRLVCQYRVFFDGQGQVERAVWRRWQCADLVLGKLN